MKLVGDKLVDSRPRPAQQDDVVRAEATGGVSGGENGGRDLTGPAASARHPGPVGLTTETQLPGATLREARKVHQQLSALVRLRAWSWTATGVVLALILLWVALTLVGDRRGSWDAASLAVAGVVGLVVLVTVLLVAQLLRSGSRFEDGVSKAFDAVVQDQVLIRSLQEGDVLGNGSTGRFIHRSAVRTLLGTTLAESSAWRPARQPWLPPSCRPARIIELAGDLALDRWCEIGLLAAAPLADENEVRFVLRGSIVPEIRTPEGLGATGGGQ